jgi:hypothetical protein
LNWVQNLTFHKRLKDHQERWDRFLLLYYINNTDQLKPKLLQISEEHQLQMFLLLLRAHQSNFSLKDPYNVIKIVLYILANLGWKIVDESHIKHDLLDFLHFFRVSIDFLLFYLCLYLICNSYQIPSLFLQRLKVLERRTNLILVEFRLKFNRFFDWTYATKSSRGYWHWYLLLLHLLRQFYRSEPVLGLHCILNEGF